MGPQTSIITMDRLAVLSHSDTGRPRHDVYRMFTIELGLLSNFDGRNSVLHVPIFVSRSDSSERITYGANVRNMNERMLRTFGNITRTVMFL